MDEMDEDDFKCTECDKDYSECECTNTDMNAPLCGDLM
jgi:hypothetical protein